MPSQPQVKLLYSPISSNCKLTDIAVARRNEEFPFASNPSTIDTTDDIASGRDGSIPDPHEPYYSNEDITILHEIITSAQDRLNDAPVPKPLPITALFQAYDEILPTHGIDPDNERHLSPFLFRVGGANGGGTLQQKLGRILERMGIELVFSDEDSQSGSAPASEGLGQNWRNESSESGNLEQGGLEEKDENTASSADSVDERMSEEELRPPATLRTSSIRSALGRWRTAAGTRPGESYGLSRPDETPNSNDLGTQSYRLPLRTSQQTNKSANNENLVQQESKFESIRPGDHHAVLDVRNRTPQQPLDNHPMAGSTENVFGRSTQEINTEKRTAPANESTLQWATSLGNPTGSSSARLDHFQPRPISTTSLRFTSPLSNQQRPLSTTVAYPDLSRVTEEDEDASDWSEPSPPVRKLTILSVMDKWKRAASKRQGTATTNEIPSAHRKDDEEPRSEIKDTRGTNMLATGSNVELAPVPIQDYAQELRTGGSGHQLDTNLPRNMAHESENNTRITNRQQTEDLDKAAQLSSTEDERLWARAIRARRIYIGSKYLNLWADITARRLEREAVARRHMVRFRCFQAWVQAPSIQMPIVEQLRAATALQKLRRAIKDQDMQLREMAAILAQRRRLRAVIKALDKWDRNRQEDMIRRELARRTVIKTTMAWLGRASDHKALDAALLSETQKANESKALQNWQVAAERGATRRHAAAQIGHAHTGLGYLRQWWDRAEIYRRSKLYREATMKDKASHVFDLWNLQARAQAFVWKTDYKTALKAVDKWLERAQAGRIMAAIAQDRAREHLTARFLGCLHNKISEFAVLDHLQHRANLYISAMKGLGAVDKVVEARQEEQKRRKRILREKAAREEKEYLEAMYVEASARRKKRSFLNALDKWRNVSVSVDMLNKTATAFRAEQDLRRNTLVCSSWLAQAEQYQKREHAVQSQRIVRWLDSWKASTKKQADQDMQAWGLWATGKQRQYLRAWTIHSLHQGGQAHTAAAVKERHSLEKRYRRLQDWRQFATRRGETTLQRGSLMFKGDDELDARGDVFRPASTSRPTRDKHRTDTEEDMGTPLQTPSKSTGTRNPYDSTPLPTRDNEFSLGHTNDGTLQPAPAFSTRSVTLTGRRTGRFQSSSRLPTTTPQAPVPSYLQQVAPEVPGSVARSTGGPTHSVQPLRFAPPDSRRPAPRSSARPQFSRFEDNIEFSPQPLFPPIHLSRSVAGQPTLSSSVLTSKPAPQAPASASRISSKRSAWIASAATRVPSNLAPSRSLRASRMMEDSNLEF